MRNPVLTFVIGLLLGLAVAGGTYFLGINSGQAQAQDQASQFFQQRGVNPNGGGAAGAQGAGQGGFFGAGGRGGGANGANGATGTITKVDGNTITIQPLGGAATATPGALTVTLGASTSIIKTVTGAPADLQVGQRIVVRGARSGNNIAATGVQLSDLPAGAGFGPDGARVSRTPTATP